MLKIGIIGGGTISEEHVRAISQHTNTKLTAIAEKNDQRREWCRENWTKNVYKDYQDMLANQSFDLIINCLPHSLHYTCTVDILNAGINVLVEKPLATSFSDCKKLIDLAKEKKLLIAVGHVIRYLPGVSRVKKWMKEDKFGDLIMMDHVRNHSNYFTGNLPQWFKNKEVSGGGILIMSGIHSIDMMQWYADSKVKRVFSKTTYSHAAPDVEASVQAFLEMENGITCTLRQSGYKAFDKVETDLYFSNGEIISDAFEDEISAIVGDTIKTPPKLIGLDPFYKQLDVVYKAIINGDPLDVDSDYSAHIVRVIEAIYLSSAESRQVNVDEIQP